MVYSQHLLTSTASACPGHGGGFLPSLAAAVYPEGADSHKEQALVRAVSSTKQTHVFYGLVNGFPFGGNAANMLF